MTAEVWKYDDVKNRTAWFRGYVKMYVGATIVKLPCKEVRKHRLQALKDAKKLLKNHEQNRIRKADRGFSEADRNSVLGIGS
jgi:hypothetical protein